MKIDHIGYAVKKIDRAIDAFKDWDSNLAK